MAEFQKITENEDSLENLAKQERLEILVRKK
jgi:hypothetical protein